MKESEKILYDLLKEVREDQKKNSENITRTVSSVERMESDLESVKTETTANTKHMGEHMRRTDGVERSVNMLTDLHKDNQKRIELLEGDSKKKDKLIQDLKIKEAVEKNTKSWLKDNIKWILGIVATIVTIVSKIMGLW